MKRKLEKRIQLYNNNYTNLTNIVGLPTYIKKNRAIRNDSRTKQRNGINSRSQITIYIYNVVEDEWSYISAIGDRKKKLHEIDTVNSTSECYLFANSSVEQFIYISPKKISTRFKKYFQGLVKAKKVHIYVPERQTNLICKDLYNDKKLFNLLIRKVKKFKRVNLIGYAASPEIYELRDRMKEKGINVSLPETPEIDSAWTVNFFGSKSGFRQLAQKSRAIEPDLIIPEGVICIGRADAARIAAHKYINEHGVVIKTNKGSGGNGVIILRPNEVSSDYKKCERSIMNMLNGGYQWEKFPIIIEDLVNVNYAVADGFPNIEFKIHKSGRIEMLYYCAMQVTREGKYYGLDIHESVVNERLAAQIIDMGYFIAEQYADAGYRGHFDIDMIAAKNGIIYVSESNTRNTGGTDVYKTALRLIGKDFLTDAYTISRFLYVEKGSLSFGKALKKLEPILFDRNTKEGVIIESENSLRRKNFLYTIFGKSKKRAYDLNTKMIDLLDDVTFAD